MDRGRGTRTNARPRHASSAQRRQNGKPALRIRTKCHKQIDSDGQIDRHLIAFENTLLGLETQRGRSRAHRLENWRLRKTCPSSTKVSSAVPSQLAAKPNALFVVARPLQLIIWFYLARQLKEPGNFARPIFSLLDDPRKDFQWLHVSLQLFSFPHCLPRPCSWEDAKPATRKQPSKISLVAPLTRNIPLRKIRLPEP